MIDRIYMSEALKQAKAARKAGDQPVGAVIVHKGKLVAKAHRQVRVLKDPTAHAVMVAITQASSCLDFRQLKSVSVYVTRRPCRMCAGALSVAGIKKVKVQRRGGRVADRSALLMR